MSMAIIIAVKNFDAQNPSDSIENTNPMIAKVKVSGFTPVPSDVITTSNLHFEIVANHVALVRI